VTKRCGMNLGEQFSIRGLLPTTGNHESTIETRTSALTLIRLSLHVGTLLRVRRSPMLRARSIRHRIRGLIIAISQHRITLVN